MKKFFTILSMFVSVVGMSQVKDTSSYPKYYIDNKGDTLGVIITIHQAQKLDNDEDILNLFKSMNLNVDSANASCIEVVDGLNKQIFLLNTEVADLKSQLNLKSQMISNLTLQTTVLQKDDSLCGDQSKLKDQEISIQKKQITKLKFQKIVGFTIGAAVIISEAYLIIIGK